MVLPETRQNCHALQLLPYKYNHLIKMKNFGAGPNRKFCHRHPPNFVLMISFSGGSPN